jgi:hypothetical protein
MCHGSSAESRRLSTTHRAAVPGEETGLLSGSQWALSESLLCWETGSETDTALVRCEPAAQLPTCDKVQGFVWVSLCSTCRA